VGAARPNPGSRDGKPVISAIAALQQKDRRAVTGKTRCREAWAKTTARYEAAKSTAIWGIPVKTICRELHVSRKVVRKVLRSEATEFHYER
jgi:hypothetical protein